MKVKAKTAFPFCHWWKGPSFAGSAAPALWIEPRPGVSQLCYISPGHSPSPPRCLRAPMPQPSVGGQQTVTGRRGRAPVSRCRRRGTPPPPQGDAWPRRVPGGGGCCSAVPVGFLCRSAAEGLSQPLFLPFSLSRPPSPANFSFEKTQTFFFFTFFFSPLQEPRCGKTGWWRREKPLPFPSPVAPSSEKKHLGGFLPSTPLPSAPLRSLEPKLKPPPRRPRAPRPRRARRTAAPPPVSRARRPLCELRGRGGGMRSAAAAGGRTAGPPPFRFGAGERRRRRGQGRAAPLSPRH